MAENKNVLGEKLETCCTAPMTGYYLRGPVRLGPRMWGRMSSAPR